MSDGAFETIAEAFSRTAENTTLSRRIIPIKRVMRNKVIPLYRAVSTKRRAHP